MLQPGTDPGFLERGFKYKEGGGGGCALLILSHFSEISYENEIIETNILHFHRISKDGGGGGGVGGGRGFELTP